MAVLNSKFDILRGWPQSSAVAEDFKTVTAVTAAPQKAGTWVELDPAATAGYTLKNVAATSVPVDTDYRRMVALVIEGKEDYSSTMSGTATCLLGGGYVVKLTNGDGYKMFATLVDDTAVVNGAGAALGPHNYRPGAPVRVKGGIIWPADLNDAGAAPLTWGATIADGVASEADENFAMLVGTVGYVLKYDSANGTLDIFVK